MSDVVLLAVPDGAVYTKQNIRDNTLDNAQLRKRCPLDNGRHGGTSSPPRQSAGMLDRFPPELLVQTLMYLDILSLAVFRRVNRRAMDLVDSLPRYAAIIKHCPNIIRAILSLQADAFSCNELFSTLSSTRCSSCNRFGDHLYLITCRRVCYFCFTQQPEYLPLTIGVAAGLFTPDGEQRLDTASSRRNRLLKANTPSVLSLPGRYCVGLTSKGGRLERKRHRLFDKRSILPDTADSNPPLKDMHNEEPKRYMCIVTAPRLFDSGRRADWGYFCVGCAEETNQDSKHLRIKYTREGISEHLATYGPVQRMKDISWRFEHAPQK